MSIKKSPLLIEFLNYLKNPTVFVKTKPTCFVILFNVFRLWSLTFIFSIFIVLFSNIILKSFNYDHSDFALNDFLKTSSPFFIIFSLVIWASIVEEVAFRLGLRFSPLRWGFSISMLCLFLIFFFNISFFSLDSTLGVIFFILFFIFLALGLFFVIRVGVVFNFLNGFYKKNFKYIFYFLGFLFAFMHISNYQENWLELWFLIPLLVLPQLLLSFLISFVRMNYGFIWAVFTHGLNNGVIACIILFFLPVLNSSDSIKTIYDLSDSDLVLVTIGSFLLFLVLVSVFFFSLLLFLEMYFYKKKEY